MPAISFKPEFRDKILDSSKIQTIRQRRKNPIKEGDILLLYINQRSKGNEFLGKAICKSVGEIKIDWQGISIKGYFCNKEHAQWIAKLDGFKNLSDMQDWFAKVYKKLPFEGQYIRWELIQ